jgi:N-methylhydantoinase A
VVLGYLDAQRFLGGRMKGDAQLAREALERVGQELHLDALETAIGVNKVVNTHMASGLRLTLEAKGLDPDKFTLVAFGGAGPLHAWRLAEEVGIRRIAVPPHPGIACATGLLQTDIVHVYMQSYLNRIDRTTPDEISARFALLVARALADASAEGFGPAQLVLNREMDLRYPHQGYELAMECGFEEPSESDLARLRTAFDSLHEQIYGVAAAGEPCEIVNLRIRAIVPVQYPEPSTRELGDAPPEAARTGDRLIYFESVGGFTPAPIYDRELLRPGAEIAGPAVVEQLDTTTVIGPGWTATAHRAGALIMLRDP